MVQNFKQMLKVGGAQAVLEQNDLCLYSTKNQKDRPFFEVILFLLQEEIV